MNVLELGLIDVYTRLPFGNEVIEITCRKINCYENGPLVATVNANQAKKMGPCESLSTGNDFSTSVDCVEQKFNYTLFMNDMSGIYDITCKFYDSTIIDQVSYRLIKLCKWAKFKLKQQVIIFYFDDLFFLLVVDSNPRIRVGSRLNFFGPIIFHKLNSTSLSCEAILDTDGINSKLDVKKLAFDNIEWFIYTSNYNLNINTLKKIPFTKTLTNYTSEFILPENYETIPNLPYKCCVTRNSIPINCQAIYFLY